LLPFLYYSTTVATLTHTIINNISVSPHTSQPRTHNMDIVAVASFSK